MTRLRPESLPSPPGHSDSASEDQLLQRRLGLLGLLSLGITAVFYAVSQVMTALGREGPWPPAAHGIFGALLALLAGMWLYCRTGRRPGAHLRALDVLMTLFMAVFMLLMPASTIPEVELRMMVILLAVSLTLYSRSIFVPSTALRTFLVSTAAAAPLAVYSVITESVRLSVWKVAWLLAAVTVATAGSGVIYGLRRDVRRARRLGQYTLGEKLGEGGMGVVYSAQHALLRRPTAVKVLRPDRTGKASLQRFEREVQLTASLSHPNTVSVYDFGFTSDGAFYYAMEYLDGLTLDEVVTGDGPQAPGRVVHVLRQVLGALGEAHDVGLIHRDIKSSNVILCQRGGLPDVAKVVDFGLVKDQATSDGLSHDGTLIGTPLFLAPEAIRSSEIDHRSDLYSLGAVGYHLLTGRHVFDGRTAVEVCGHHLHTPPVSPSERLGRPLPRDLEAWILSCLEKNPGRRPPTASAAAQALERCAVGEEWTPESARRWWREQGQALRKARGSGREPSGATLTLPLDRAMPNPSGSGSLSRLD